MQPHLPSLVRWGRIVRRMVAIAILGLAAGWSFPGAVQAQSAGAGKDWTGHVGAGAASFPRYTGGKGADVTPVPLLMFEYKETYYVDLLRAGVRLWSTDDKKLAFGLAAEPRFGFKARDGALLAGMAKRRHSIELGPSVEWETQAVSLNFAWFNDVMGASKGSSWRASAYKQWVNTSSWDVGTYVTVERESARVVNYYFGVPAGEVTPNRALYTPGAATHLSLGVQAAWTFVPRYSLLLGVQNTRIGSAAANSPIVETRNAPIAYIGLGWRL